MHVTPFLSVVLLLPILDGLMLLGFSVSLLGCLPLCLLSWVVAVHIPPEASAEPFSDSTWDGLCRGTLAPGQCPVLLLLRPAQMARWRPLLWERDVLMEPCGRRCDVEPPGIAAVRSAVSMSGCNLSS